MSVSGNSNTSNDGLRKLNKDLLTRNAELVQRLNRMKSERDNFEQLFTDWKKINKDASEALNLLQKEKKLSEAQNVSLHKQIQEYKMEIASLKLQNNERMEQCDHLLLRCNQYQNDINQLKQQINGNSANANINTLKFNYQQKKNEIDQILHQIHRLFAFCHTNYPQITSNLTPHANYKSLLDDIEEYAPHTVKHNKQKKNRDFTVQKKQKHRSTRSLSDFDKQMFRKRRSLNYIDYNGKPKSQLQNKQNDSNKQRIMINNDFYPDIAHKKIRKNMKKKVINNIDSKITPELLGPKTSYHQYDNKRSDPFGRTQSSHSFFSEQTQQRLRYNQVTLNMTGSKLWSKRDSLSRKKKKQPRINTIPSSAGTTPLTTPQQSRRGRISDEEEDDPIYFVDDDPHQKYLEMMGGDHADGAVHNARDGQIMPNPSHQKPQIQNKLSDKKTIHDLFDMLQQQTLSPCSPNHQQNLNSNTNNNNDFYDDDVQESNDAPLVSLPDDSSSDSDSSSD
eukprot:26897_1